MVLAPVKVELARVRRERDKAKPGRNPAVWGAATAARERDKARAEKDVVHMPRQGRQGMPSGKGGTTL